MRTQVGKFPHLLIWCSGIAMGLLCAGGIAAYMGWIPTSIASRGDNAVPVNLSAAPAEPAGAKRPTAQAPSPGPLRAREPGAKPAKSKHEFTVRLRGESSRVLGESNLPAWRLGAPVKVIEGEVPLMG